MQKKWVLKKRGDDNFVNALTTDLKISPILANLLVQRGIKTFEEAKDFFRPQL